MNPAPETMPTPIWGVRLIVNYGPEKQETYTLDVTKWKVFLWLTWQAARNQYTRLTTRLFRK